MRFDVERLACALDAEHELFMHAGSNDSTHFFRFHDSLLRYELRVEHHADTVMLAADPTEPIQGCPLLGFSFRCVEIEIGANAYSDTAGDAIRFWEHRSHQEGIRLVLSPRDDNRWYIWANAWDKLVIDPTG